ncbi:MAG: hypothetical protein C0425_02480 [Chlorobiaceae bacterium]|nr:hypothetical protein [Chlorobiaceae bacterium]MBA4309187.1 hypothetical protein [Chlorobiaceae bacterium]
MKTNSTLILFLLLFNFSFNEAGNKISLSSYDVLEYFPLDENVKLFYDSQFGEAITTFKKNGKDFIVDNSSDKFIYRQIMNKNEKGVFVKETYQNFKVLPFVTKENTFTYSNPLLRIPKTITDEWAWEGTEKSGNDDVRKISVKGKVLGNETIVTQAGTFKTIKIETVVASSDGAKNILTEWLAPNIGMVKMTIKVEGGGVIGLLRDILGFSTIEFLLTKIERK